MRIIAGRDKGRRLKSLDRRDVRPTSDRTKEAIFNILGPIVSGTRFLDLYSGFGGIGIEALSRGAEEVICVEKDRRNLKVIEENLSMVGYEDRSRVVGSDVLKALGRISPDFDIIFMDPPYGQEDLYLETLKGILDYKLLHPTGILVVEYDSKKEPPLVEGYELIKKKKYGKSGVLLMRYNRKGLEEK